MLLLSLILTLVPVCISAAGGRWESVTWEVTDGRLTVSGGDIPDSTASDRAPWAIFSGKITSLVIGDGVTAIGERAFEDLSLLTSADLGKVKTVGRMAFSGCTALGAVTLPATVETVGDFAFAECSSLRKFTISEKLSSLGEGVWESCTSLGAIEGSSAGYTVNGGVLYTADKSAVVKYPAAKAAATYTAPAETVTVMPGAFRDAGMLKSVELHGVKNIGDGAFYGCVSISELDITAAETIGRAAFYGCKGLFDVTFGKGLRALGDEAFAGCSSLSVANFEGDAPETVSEGVFFGHGMSFTVTVRRESAGFGDGNTWLGYYIVRHGIYSGSVGSVGWDLDTATGTMTLTGNGGVPDFEYASDAPWYQYRKLIRRLSVASDITGIGDNSFRYSALESVYLPKSVSDIGDWAFSGCEALTEVTAEGEVTLGMGSFFGDVSLSVAKLLRAISVGKQAFSGCETLRYVKTGATAPRLGELAFDGTGASVLYPAGGTGYSGGEWDNVYSEAYTAGDANGDGSCNISDVSLMLKYIAKWDVAVKTASADANADGYLSLADAAQMLKFIAKWDVTVGI